MMVDEGQEPGLKGIDDLHSCPGSGAVLNHIRRASVLQAQLGSKR